MERARLAARVNAVYWQAEEEREEEEDEDKKKQKRKRLSCLTTCQVVLMLSDLVDSFYKSVSWNYCKKFEKRKQKKNDCNPRLFKNGTISNLKSESFDNFCRNEIHPSICLPARSSIYPSIHSQFIHLSIHPFSVQPSRSRGCRSLAQLPQGEDWGHTRTSVIERHHTRKLQRLKDLHQRLLWKMSGLKNQTHNIPGDRRTIERRQSASPATSSTTLGISASLVSLLLHQGGSGDRCSSAKVQL